ncbi:MAG: GNAT family N-acetyltransferase, partial [Rhodothermales bacterium]
MRRPAGEIQVRQDAASGHVSIVKVDLTSLKVIKDLNTTIFREDRIINTFDREDLMILLALVDNVPAGFKIGYRENRFTYYSAKGGVLPEYRRQGLARKMLYFMMAEARVRGYIRFAFDTFPNRDRGMTVLGLNEGF